MKLGSPEQLVSRWFEEVWNNPQVGAVEDLFAENGRMLGVGREPIVGRQAFREFRDTFRHTFSDFNIQVTQVAETADGVLVRFTLEMTQTASGKRISVDSGGWARFVDGQLTEAHNFIDFLEVLKQLGAAPEDSLERVLVGERLVFEEMEA